MLYLLETETAPARIETIQMPLGSLTCEKTVEGDCVWLRNTHRPGVADVVFGSLKIPAGSPPVFYAVDHDTWSSCLNKDVTLLRRPSMSEVMRVFADYVSDTTAGSKRKLVTEAHEEKQLALEEENAFLRAKLQKMEDDEEDAPLVQRAATSAVASAVVAPMATAQVVATREDSFKVFNAFITTTLLAFESADAKIVSEHAPKKTNKASKKKKVAAYAYQFVDDTGKWTITTDAQFAAVYKDIYDQQHKLPHKYRFNSFNYEASDTTSTANSHGPEKELARYEQHNLETGKKRLVRIIEDPASDPASASTTPAALKKAEKAARLTFVAGDTFPCTAAASTVVAQQLASYNYDLDDRVILYGGASLTEQATIERTTLLMQLFNDFCGESFKYDPAKTELLFKPNQLRNVLSLIVAGKATHWRPVVHATSNAGLQKIRDDAVGLDFSYSSTGCRFGSANYVATTLDASEGRNGQSRFNSTGVNGKVVLALFFCPRETLSNGVSSMPTPWLTAYNFASNARDDKNKQIQDAVAVSHNNCLLPIAIVSP